MGKFKGQARGAALVLPGFRSRSGASTHPPRPVQGELHVTLSEEQYRYCSDCCGTGTDWSDLDPTNIPFPPCRVCFGNGGWWEPPSVSGSPVLPGQMAMNGQNDKGQG